MKLALIADFHLGFSGDSLPQARMALEKATQMADVILLAGDLFDYRVPKQEVVNDAVKLFRNSLQELRQKPLQCKIYKNGVEVDVPIVSIPGTHERRTKGLVNVIELLESTGLIVNCHNQRVVIESTNGDGIVEKVAVIGLAGVPEEFVRDVFKAADFKPLANHFNVFVFHQSLKEVIPISDFISCNDLPVGFDLYFNGHIHWRKEIKSDGKLVLIPGSTVITQMRRNETEKKGFWLFDTQTHSYEFIFIDSRPFFFNEIELQNATLGEIKQKVNEVVESCVQNAGAIKSLIKIKLRGSLASGVDSAVVNSTQLASSFTNAEVYIDKDFEVSGALRDKIELIRQLKSDEKSVSEIGTVILKKQLQQNNFALDCSEELFSALSEKEVETAIEILKKSSSKLKASLST
ncbi:MAG: metallophosphoesterase [Candidatus Micrarchaeota archaeon]